jgi:N-acetyl-anhydromuramyl-L-alanine amidase AmpD
MPVQNGEKFTEEASRAIWHTGSNISNAEPYTKVHPVKRPKLRQPEDIKRIVIHCTAANWTLEQLVDYDLGPNHISATGCSVATYSDVIFADGQIKHVVDYTKETWHVGNWNYSSLGIALMYNPGPKDAIGPSNEAYVAMLNHCALLAMRLGLLPSDIVGHRELKDTGWILDKDGNKQLRKTCPGMSINLDTLRLDIAFLMQFKLKNFGYLSSRIDGIFGPKSKEALKQFKEARK